MPQDAISPMQVHIVLVVVLVLVLDSLLLVILSLKYLRGTSPLFTDEQSRTTTRTRTIER